VGQRVVGDQRGDVAKFGGFRLQKLAPRRSDEEKVANFNAGALRPGDFFHIAQLAAGEFNARAGILRCVFCFQHQSRNRGD